MGVARVYGYSNNDDLPDYRVHATRSVGFFADNYRQLTLDIPMSVLKEPLKSRFGNAHLAVPISQYEELLTQDSDGAFQLPWPQNLALHIGPKVFPIQCLKMWQELPRAAVAGLVDTVKTRVLSMVLDIEVENPAAGEIAGSALPIPENKVAQIFNTNIYGGQVGNLAAGSTGLVQNVGDQIAQGDTEALAKYLSSLGIQASAAAELVKAVDNDKLAGETGLGSRVTAWIGRLHQRLNESGADVAKQAVAGLATQAILSYLGIGG